jgi:hypothetical protein
MKRRSPTSGAATTSTRGASSSARASRPKPDRQSPRRTARTLTFKAVETLARTLADVEVGTSWGKPALKFRGTMFVCEPSHSSAEPNSIVVRMDVAERDLLINEEPETYYVKEHYVNYPYVLVRMSQVSPDALRDLIVGAHRHVASKASTRLRSQTMPPARSSPRASRPGKRTAR